LLAARHPFVPDRQPVPFLVRFATKCRHADVQQSRFDASLRRSLRETLAENRLCSSCSRSRGIRLHDLASARGEHEEISAKHPLVTRWLTDALSTFLIYQGRWRQARWGVFSNHLAAAPQDLEQGTGPKKIRP